MTTGNGQSEQMDSTDYRRLFLEDIPLIDLRAPIEFQQGAFPQAVNLPLMLDKEREAVGLCYKQQGQQAALELGKRLVAGEVRAARMTAWRRQCERFPRGYLYCFRGGLRSHIVQQWLRDSGIHYPLVTGGYKALRQFLLHVTEQVAGQPLQVVGGNTGCGKTRLIQSLNNGVDLEGLAHHRGSSFGRTLTAQSRQIDFEHRLAVQLLKKQQAGCQRWILEDEGKMIGSNHLPLPLYQQMQQSPVVVIDDPFPVRLQRLQEEYIDHMQAAFAREYGVEEGWQQYRVYLYQGLFAIRRRLGLARFQQLVTLQEQALAQQLSGDSQLHRQWLIPLLQEYYDPMYRYQLEKKQERIIYRGSYAAVRDYLLESEQAPVS